MCFRLIAIMVSALAGAAVCVAGDATPFDGMDAREVAATLREQWRPKQLVLNDLGDGGRWDVVREYGLDAQGRYIDFFSTDPGPTYDGNPDLPPEDMALVELAPLAWWALPAVDEWYHPDNDLYNLLPAHSDATAQRGRMIPGVPQVVEYDNGVWRTGTRTFGTTDIHVFEPPVGLEGDVARVYFYLASVYPAQMWASPASLVFAYGTWPLLTDYARELLLQWHRQDPPDEREIRRDEAISRAQGCGNPFVAYPQLAEILWAGAENPGEPGTLRGVYSAATDRLVWLRSQFVPDDAVWTIDGVRVDGETVAVSSLSQGTHLLKYTAPGRRGALKIEIKP